MTVVKIRKLLPDKCPFLLGAFGSTVFLFLEGAFDRRPRVSNKAGHSQFNGQGASSGCRWGKPAELIAELMT